MNQDKSSLEKKGPIADGLSVDGAATSSLSIENLYKEGVLDPVYHAKTSVLNHALQEIGMGKYQVHINYYNMIPLLISWPQVHTPRGGRHGMVCVSPCQKHRQVSLWLNRCWGLQR